MFQKKPEVSLARTATTIRRDLAYAQSSIGPITSRLAEARAEMGDAQRRFDAGVRAAAVGDRPIPDRHELTDATNNVDALVRVEDSARALAQELAAELASVELADAIATSGEKLPQLTAAAESKLARFVEALRVTRESEAELFTILFDPNDGFRQRFEHADLQALALKARRGLASRAMKLCAQSRYRLDPRFETDGERNLGIEDGFFSH